MESIQLVALLGDFIEELRLRFEIDFGFEALVIVFDQRSTFVVEASDDRMELAHDETFEGVIGHVGLEFVVDGVDLECDGGCGLPPSGAHEVFVRLEVDIGGEDVEGDRVIGGGDRRIENFSVSYIDVFVGIDVGDNLPRPVIKFAALEIFDSFLIDIS